MLSYYKAKKKLFNERGFGDTRFFLVSLLSFQKILLDRPRNIWRGRMDDGD